MLTKYVPIRMLIFSANIINGLERYLRTAPPPSTTKALILQGFFLLGVWSTIVNMSKDIRNIPSVRSLYGFFVFFDARF